MLCGTTTLAASHASSITAPKYKKSSIQSTMTALHVAPRPRAPLHVDDTPHVFLASLRPMTLPTHEHDHTPFIIGPNSNSIISMGSPSHHHHTTLPPLSLLSAASHIHIPNARTNTTPLPCVSSHPCALYCTIIPVCILHCSYIMTWRRLTRLALQLQHLSPPSFALLRYPPCSHPLPHVLLVGVSKK